MKDGRLLTVSRQLYPEQKGAMLVAMRPDGTKADMFYMNKGRSIMASGPVKLMTVKYYSLSRNPIFTVENCQG
jgi:hypothetical protein